MNTVLWSQVLEEIKEEADVTTGDTTLDAFLLAAANDTLKELIGISDNLRDFRLVHTQGIVAGPNPLPAGLYFREIEQIYYVNDDPAYKWALTENTGRVCPAPIDERPSSYVLIGSLTTPGCSILFKPYDGNAADTMEIIGTGFQEILDGDSEMPYLAMIPAIKKAVLQRLQIKRGLPREQTDAWEAPIARANQAAGVSAKDAGGNTVVKP